MLPTSLYVALGCKVLSVRPNVRPYTNDGSHIQLSQQPRLPHANQVFHGCSEASHGGCQMGADGQRLVGGIRTKIKV
jgi:hypothetical protein